MGSTTASSAALWDYDGGAPLGEHLVDNKPSLW